MSKIKKLILRDVRCFKGKQEFDIRPLTFLIGENSTGKSTALGCLQALGDFIGRRGRENEINFNSDPYQMGAFADIVRRSPKRNSFQLGFEIDTYDTYVGVVNYLVTLHEEESGSDPIINEIKYTFNEGEITLVKGKESNKPFNVIAHDKNKFIVSLNRDYALYRGPNYLEYLLFSHSKSENKEMTNDEKKLLKFIQKQIKDKKLEIYGFFHYIHRTRDVYSFPPIRSKPKRTYDPFRETSSSEGSEVSIRLKNLNNKKDEKWDELHKRLIKFGKESGLFTGITVRNLGNATNDPFQLQIKVRGPAVNLVDVGYGVSQILPILVRILSATDPTMFLLQQPEVHLHPKGQAELSSLLVNLHKTNKHSFIIESHSDYMVDRTRLEIMKGNINPDDVSLIYLEPTGNKVKVHNIKFDNMGNMLGAPANYRRFFLNETIDLLGFGIKD